MYRVPNYNSTLPQSTVCMAEKIKPPAGNTCNFISLLNSSVVSASSNDVTNNLKISTKKKNYSKSPNYLEIINWSFLHLNL